MATFEIKSKKKMEARFKDGLSSVYNKQTLKEYNRTWNHISNTWNEILEAAIEDQNPELLLNPLKGFPRQGKDNYCAYDIFADLKAQYDRKEDFLDSKIGRWNRLFENYPELQVNFEIPTAIEHPLITFQNK